MTPQELSAIQGALDLAQGLRARVRGPASLVRRWDRRIEELTAQRDALVLALHGPVPDINPDELERDLQESANEGEKA